MEFLQNSYSQDYKGIYLFYKVLLHCKTLRKFERKISLTECQFVLLIINVMTLLNNKFLLKRTATRFIRTFILISKISKKSQK